MGKDAKEEQYVGLGHSRRVEQIHGQSMDIGGFYGTVDGIHVYWHRLSSGTWIFKCPWITLIDSVKKL